MGRQGYPAEFRRKVLDLLAEGRSVASVAHDLDVSLRTRRGGSQPPYKRSWKSWRARPPPTQVSATQLMGSRAVS